MKRYEFTLTLSGYGNNIQEAWNDATDSFAQDPGSPEDTDYEITDEDWSEE